VLGSNPIVFSANIGGGMCSWWAWSLYPQATGYNNPQGSQVNGDKMFAISTTIPGARLADSPVSAFVAFLLLSAFRNHL
jgi:hypothetical protein